MTEQEQQNIKAFAQIAGAQRKAYLAAIGKSQELSAEHLEQLVLYYLTNPSAVVSSLHEDWSHRQYKDGWTYGTAFDEEKKTHPMLVAFNELPIEKQVEDLLFMQTVQTLSRLM